MFQSYTHYYTGPSPKTKCRAAATATRKHHEVISFIAGSVMSTALATADTHFVKHALGVVSFAQIATFIVKRR